MWAAVIVISVMAIGVWGVTEIVRVGTRTKENLERIRHGYPTLDGSVPHSEAKADEYVDFRDSGIGNKQ